LDAIFEFLAPCGHLLVVSRPLVVHVLGPLVAKTVQHHHASAHYEVVKTVASHAPALYKAVNTMASQASGGHVSPPPQHLPPKVTEFPQAVYEQSIDVPFVPEDELIHYFSE
jgi:hypothetical protein